MYAGLTSAGQWQYPVPVARLEALHTRLLFGTDIPNTTIRIADTVVWVRRLGLSAAALLAVLGGNAQRLLP